MVVRSKATIANACVTAGAAIQVPSPAWFTSMLHVPGDTVVKTPVAVTVQTAVVVDVNVTARPELAVASNCGESPKSLAPGLAKVIVWAPCGVTLSMLPVGR